MLLVLAMGRLPAQYSPPDSPQFTQHFTGNGLGCGYLFIGPYRVATPFYLKAANHLLDRFGNTVWYYQGNRWILDFKLQPSGHMTFNDENFWHLLDSNFALVDSVTCRNGYATDPHDLLVTADQHYFLICIEDTTMDLSAIHTATGGMGASLARVDGVVIQELDNAKNVVKEWHGRDYYQPADVDSTYFTNPSWMELNHTNSIDLDADGQMLISHRALNEVAKVDWASGQIRWRLGGKHNQFDLQGDPGTIGQHDARPLPGNRISIFDNGNYAKASRAVIYQLDTVAMQATVEWAFTNPIGGTNAMGSFQRLPNGNSLICSGMLLPYSLAPIVFVAADCTTIFDISFADSSSSYRAQCTDLPFELHRPTLTCSNQSGQLVLGLQDPAAHYQWSTGDTSATIVVTSPGWYQAFVSRGIGMIGTEPVEITNLLDGCLPLATAPTMDPRPKPRKLIGYFDLMGRPLANPVRWQVIIARYDDGSSRKSVWMAED